MEERDYPKPSLSGDTVLVRRADADLEVLLIRRGRDPYRGSWALPGGFVEPFERPVDAARRELAEETGLAFEGPLVLVGVYGERGRDPRGWTVSAAYVGLIDGPAPDVVGGDDAEAARWFPIGALPALAFDHATIVADALATLGSD